MAERAKEVQGLGARDGSRKVELVNSSEFAEQEKHERKLGDELIAKHNVLSPAYGIMSLVRVSGDSVPELT